MRARMQRLYLFTLSCGHFHRNAFPASLPCSLCLPLALPHYPDETIPHLFFDCQIAALFWAAFGHFWSTLVPDHPFPTSRWDLVTGDLTHRDEEDRPPHYFWLTFHTICISVIYLTRCDIVFRKTNPIPSPIQIINQGVGLLKSSLRDAIRASRLELNSKGHFGRSRFRQRWAVGPPQHPIYRTSRHGARLHINF